MTRKKLRTKGISNTAAKITSDRPTINSERRSICWRRTLSSRKGGSRKSTNRTPVTTRKMSSAFCAMTPDASSLATYGPSAVKPI